MAELNCGDRSRRTGEGLVGSTCLLPLCCLSAKSKRICFVSFFSKIRLKFKLFQAYIVPFLIILYELILTLLGRLYLFTLIGLGNP